MHILVHNLIHILILILSHTLIHILIHVLIHILTQILMHVLSHIPIRQYSAHATSTSCSYSLSVSAYWWHSCYSCTPPQCQQTQPMKYQAYITNVRV